MRRRSAFVVGCTVLSATLVHATGAQAGCRCRCPDPCRGCAIMSPIESPDPCDPPVGGAYKYRPYYRGYAPDFCCFPPMYGTVSSYPYSGPGFGPGGLGTRPAPYGGANYGAFSGASRDEARLLRLGGFGAAGNGSYRPSQNVDVIDRIQSGR